jgi:hypothetical protein
MANAIVLNTRVAADSVDALNRSVIATEDMQNGTPLTLEFPTEAGSNVFKATKNTTGKDVWLAYSPEVLRLIVGETYGGVDIRYFTNVANKPFDAFKLQVGDIIQVTKEFFADGKSPADNSNDKAVVISADGFETAADVPESGFGMKIGRMEPMIIASTGIGGEQVDAWLLEVVSL